MEDLLRGSGLEHLLGEGNEKKVGGISKAVGFVRKAMIKTKNQNKGYKPPARYGYDFNVAKELDKPSKHIQINIGRVSPDKVVKYKYNRKKPSQKSKEEAERDKVHKFEYWGLTKDDFEEVDGELIEKQHGIIWPPIYYKRLDVPDEGRWGLRCCRYDNNGDTIPSNEKYQWIYFREDDGVDLVPPTAKKEPILKSDPPEEIENEVDDEDVKLERYFAAAKLNRFDYRLENRTKAPFFWYANLPQTFRQNAARRHMILPSERATYEDIPVIISANRAMRKFIRTYQTSTRYGEKYFLEQKDRWDQHLSNISPSSLSGEQKEVLMMARARREINKREKKPYKTDAEIDEEVEAVGKEKGRTFRGIDGKTDFKQQGRFKSAISGNKWGKARAEWAYDRLDVLQTEGFALYENMAYTIGANEELIRQLIENPIGTGIDYEKIEKEANEIDWGDPENDPLEFNRENQSETVKAAEANLPKEPKAKTK